MDEIPVNIETIKREFNENIKSRFTAIPNGFGEKTDNGKTPIFFDWILNIEGLDPKIVNRLEELFKGSIAPDSI